MTMIVRGEERDLPGRWELIKQVTLAIRTRSQRFVAQLVGQDTSVNEIGQYAIDMDAFIVQLDGLTTNAVASGLVAYVEAAVQDPTYNVVTEYQALRAALDAVVVRVGTDMNGLSAKTWNGTSRSFDVPTLTPVQTANLQTDINALLATLPT